MNIPYGMPPPEITNRNPIYTRIEEGVKWWLLDDCWSYVISDVTYRLLNTHSIAKKDVFKYSERRLVFKYFEEKSGQNFIVKAFPLIFFRHRLKQRKYAFSEAKHLLIAKDRGIHVPEVYGYGVQKKFGLVSFNVVLMQYVDQLALVDYLRHKNEAECLELLKQRVTPLFIKMYLAGVNHIDCDPSAILLSNTDPAKDMLIDFQYVSFFHEKSLLTLVAQLGYFSWSVMYKYKFMSLEKLRSWFEYTMNSIDVECDDLMWTVYEERTKKVGSIKSRLIGYALDKDRA